MRKIIDIVADDHGVPTVLCDDGTVWFYLVSARPDDKDHWRKLEDIPQDEPQE